MLDIEDYRPGFNAAFLKRLKLKKAKRARANLKRREARRAARETALPKAHPHDFRSFPGKTASPRDRTVEVKAERSALAAKSEAIREETRQLKFNPEDAQKTPAQILCEVARKHGVSKEQIRGNCRARWLVAVKWQVMCRIYVSKLNVSLHLIGMMTGKDHTTVVNALQRMGVWRRGTPGRVRYRAAA